MKCKGIYKATMAGFYGIQFEALMKEVCEDFGRRLIKSWDEGADKDEVVGFVRDAVDAFFKKTKGVEVRIEAEKIESPKKKAKKTRVSKKKSEPEPDSPSGLTDTEEPKKKPKGTGKGKAGKGGKPKCEGVTAKGTQCSKCAVEGEVFCSIHLKKKKEDEPEKEAKGKAAKGKGKKKEEAPVHTHEIGEKAEDGECEVCEKYGDVFEVPEYEEVIENDGDDPDFKLEEEDFDEDEDDIV